MLNSPDTLAARTLSAHRFAAPLTDDECLQQLAAVIETHDNEQLAEVAGLIGRLAVPIE